MDFSIGAQLITGMMLGIELATEEDSKYMVLDLFIVRLVFCLHPME